MAERVGDPVKVTHVVDPNRFFMCDLTKTEVIDNLKKIEVMNAKDFEEQKAANETATTTKYSPIMGDVSSCSLISTLVYDHETFAVCWLLFNGL